MAHLASCPHPAANIGASLPGSIAEAWQQKQGGSRQLWPVQQQPARLRRQQPAGRPAGRLFHNAAFASEHIPSVQEYPLLQKKQRGIQQSTECELDLEQAFKETGRAVVGASLAAAAHESRGVARKVLQGLPAAAVFWASEVALAAGEIEQPVVIANEDELPNKIIAVLFTLGVLALSILTAGVIYLSLTEFKEKRDIAKQELLEKRAPRRRTEKGVEPAKSKSKSSLDVYEKIQKSETPGTKVGPKQ
ncbi:hypothetical protein KFL_003420070 [Klebsormidium nitens]|uniref:Uncharacterized protein n=1 Tax=Klebsormidium nitens TaxID=105231 RepID=A0A1Y1IGJ9_KLENI|nr:hypothetical protein KFL_003420070 [Klebsormidium nitens]|eukprot:GAQ87268.1 hypothetical protein KFL_003420070 [Klebsormidium nitens]